MTAKTDNATTKMLSILTDLWNSTCQASNPKHDARVYLEMSGGITAHGVVGGETKAEIESKVQEAIPRGVRVVKIEKADENPVNHPLRGE